MTTATQAAMSFSVTARLSALVEAAGMVSVAAIVALCLNAML